MRLPRYRRTTTSTSRSSSRTPALSGAVTTSAELASRRDGKEPGRQQIVRRDHAPAQCSTSLTSGLSDDLFKGSAGAAQVPDADASPQRRREHRGGAVGRKASPDVAGAGYGQDHGVVVRQIDVLQPIKQQVR